MSRRLPDSSPASQPTTSEQDLERATITTAHIFGWRVAHFRAARTSHGWRTPVAADGAGFPDLVLVHPGSHPGAGRVLFRELKAERGRLSREQSVWIETLAASGADVSIWHPTDWPSIVSVLSFGKASP